MAKSSRKARAGPQASDGCSDALRIRTSNGQTLGDRLTLARASLTTSKSWRSSFMALAMLSVSFRIWILRVYGLYFTPNGRLIVLVNSLLTKTNKKQSISRGKTVKTNSKPTSHTRQKTNLGFPAASPTCFLHCVCRGAREPHAGGKPKVVTDTPTPALLGKDPADGFINNLLLYT